VREEARMRGKEKVVFLIFSFPREMRGNMGSRKRRAMIISNQIGKLASI
jgi:hypothetical protein